MTLALLIAGIIAFVAGLLAILFGFTVREFSVGSTLIISGTLGVCSGMVLAGLYAVVVELKVIARRLTGPAVPSEVRVRPVLPGLTTPGASALEPTSSLAARAEPASAPPAGGSPPWHGEAAARERPRVEVPPEPEPPAVSETPRRRNLLFSSTSRKERERGEAKAAEASPSMSHEEPAAPGAPGTPPASFDDAWPKPDRMRPTEPPAAPRRPLPRSPSTFAEAAPEPPAAPEPAPEVEQAPVTVLKSGIVDGMAYSLYSDGSIEAQMPEGMMRFASIDELRAHLDQRS
jgi:hypothetical protein